MLPFFNPLVFFQGLSIGIQDDKALRSIDNERLELDPFEDLDVDIGDKRNPLGPRRNHRAGNGGRIVTIASSAALRPYKWRSHYAASKLGIIALTRVAALEFAEHKITANIVAPGPTDTENRRLQSSGGIDNEKEAAEMRAREARIPLGMVKPEDIANAVHHFTLPASGHVTAQTMLVDGGVLMT